MPEELENQESSLIGTVARAGTDFAKGMLTFGLMTFAGSLGFRALGKGFKTAYNAFLKGPAGKNFQKSDLYQTLSKSSTMFKSFHEDMKAYKAFTDSEKIRYKDTFRKAREGEEANIFRRQLDFYKEKAVNFIGTDGKFGQRARGLGYSIAKHTATDLATFYAMERITGTYDKEAGFGHFLKENIPISLGFGAITKGFKPLINTAKIRATNSIANSKFMQEVAQKSIKFISNTANKINIGSSIAYATAKDTYQYIKREGLRDNLFRDTYREFKHSFHYNKGKIIKRNNPYMSLHGVIVEAANEFLSDKDSGYKKNIIASILKEHEESKFKGSRNGPFKYYGLNLKRYKFTNEKEAMAKINDVIDMAIENDKRFTDSTKEKFKKQITETIGKRYNNFVDENLYQIDKGKKNIVEAIDLRYIHWKNMVSKLVDTADSFFTFGAIKPLSFLQIPQTIHALKGEKIASFTGNKNFNNNIIISKNFIKDEYAKNETIFKDSRIQKDSFFINGKFYIKENNGTLTNITKDGVDIHLSSYFGKQNIFTKTLLNISGRNQQSLDLYTYYDNKILDLLDMKGILTNEGFIGRNINQALKLFGKQNPNKFLNIYDNLLKDFSKVSETDKESFSNMLQNYIKYTDDKRSKIFLNKEVRKDIHISSRNKSLADLNNDEIMSTVSELLRDTSAENKELIKNLNIDFIYNQLKHSYAPDKILTKTRKSLGLTTEITNKDTLLEYIGISQINSNPSIISQLHRSQRITQLESSILAINRRKADILSTVNKAKTSQKDLLEHLFVPENVKNTVAATPILQGLETDFKNISSAYYNHDFLYVYHNIYKEFNPTTIKNIKSAYQGIENTGYFVMPTTKNPIVMNDVNTGKDVTIGSVNFFLSTINERFNRLLTESGFGLTKSLSGGPGNYYKGLFLKRILPAAGAIYGLSFIDDVVETVNPFGHRGLVEIGADAFVNIRKGLAHAFDITGITATAKYMEGLMPGSVDSTLSRGLRGFGVPILGSMAAGPVGLLAGLGLSALQGFGFFDMTASSEDIDDVYSGRKMVPYKKGRWWVFGQGDFSGSKVETMIPNWYARMKSHYLDNEDNRGNMFERLLFEPLPLLGFNPIGDLIDNGHYAKKHQYSYPTPVTGSPFEEVPLFGPILSAATSWMPLIGSQSIRENEWKKDLVSKGVPFPGMGTSNASMYYKDGLSNNYTQKTGIGQAIDETLYQMQEFAGLWGFAGNALIEGLIGSKPFERQQVLESGRSIASAVRSFWDANVGDPMITGIGETVRRLVVRPRYGRSVQTINPLTNAQPEWMPDDLERGNVLSKMPMAEIRTPGRSYEALHDVRYTFPVESSYLGLDSQEMVRYMLGLYKKSNLSDFSELMTSQYNEGVKEKDVYDTGLNIHGSYSSVKTINGEKTLVKYVNVNNSQLSHYKDLPLSGRSDVNFLMKQAGAQRAQLIYINNGQILGTDDIKFSQELYSQDIANVEAARIEASKLLKEGYGFTGQAYSHIDRFKILADIAPYSNEYFREKKFVEQEIKEGNKDIQDEYRTAIAHRTISTNKRELYPYRFRPEGSPLGIKYFKDLIFGDSMNMSAYSEENIYNLNENIKSADQYSSAERIVGSLWETISHMDIPFISRFMYYRTPLEDYKRSYLYGRDVKLWEKPYEHWIKPEYEKFRSHENPISGAIQTGFLSWVFGGFDRTIGTLGAIFGASYGAAHGLFNALNGSTYISSRVNEEREVNQAFDKLKYDRGKLLYEFTGDAAYLKESKKTIRGLLDTPVDKLTPDSIRRAMYKQEKYYINSFLDEQNLANKEEILRFVPEDVGEVLTKYWNKRDDEDIEAPKQHIHQQIMNPTSLYSPNINLDDIKYSYIASEGMDNYAFGLGYLDQLNRVNANPDIRNYAEEIRFGNMAPEPMTNDTTVIKKRIEGLLNQYRVFSIVEVTNSMNNELRIING